MDHRQQRLLVSVAGLAMSGYLMWRMLKAYEAMAAPQPAVLAGAARAQRLKARAELNEYELQVAADLVFAEDLQVGFGQVAGLDEVKQGLRDVIAPFRHPDRPQSRLRAAPKGVLLYGPPGNGKTMVASALAKECGASFLNLKSSTIFQKYVGESEKMALAVFTLARKIQPCLIFLDEVDLVLSRDSLHVANNKVIGILLAEWDGLSNAGESNNVVVVAATNNPKNIETALHRRMPRQFYIGPPDAAQREKILRKILVEDESAGVRISDGLIRQVAAQTDRYCGSDLFELCKVALNAALRDEPDQGDWVPSLEMSHFVEAMRCVRYAGASADEQLIREFTQ